MGVIMRLSLALPISICLVTSLAGKINDNAIDKEAMKKDVTKKVVERKINWKGNTTSKVGLSREIDTSEKERDVVKDRDSQKSKKEREEVIGFGTNKEKYDCENKQYKEKDKPSHKTIKKTDQRIRG